MFTLQNWKSKLVYIGFGSFFGCLCTIMGMLASPVTAQRDKFGHIECTSLTIVDETGKGLVELGIRPVLSLESGKLKAIIGRSGSVIVYNADRKAHAWLSFSEHGGSIGAFSNDFLSSVYLNFDDHGGGLEVSGKNGGRVHLRVNDDGGAVSAYGKDGKPRARLRVDEHGGVVQVEGKGEGAAVMGINEYGNGAVSTWDKNGYRQ